MSTMSSTLNKGIPSNGTSSSGAFILTPPSSSYAATHASAAGSNNTTAGNNQPWEPSYQLQAYLSRPARDDVWSAYGRLASQPQHVDPNGYIAHHTRHAQQAIARFDKQFRR